MTELFVIEYTDDNETKWYWSNYGLNQFYVPDINYAQIFHFESDAQRFANSLEATKPKVIQVNIVPVNESKRKS